MKVKTNMTTNIRDCLAISYGSHNNQKTNRGTRQICNNHETNLRAKELIIGGDAGKRGGLRKHMGHS